MMHGHANSHTNGNGIATTTRNVVDPLSTWRDQATHEAGFCGLGWVSSGAELSLLSCAGSAGSFLAGCSGDTLELRLKPAAPLASGEAALSAHFKPAC